MKRAHLEGYHGGHHITGQRRARTNPRSGSKEQTAAHATHSGPTIQPGSGFGSVTPVMALELSHVQRGPPRLSVIILSLQIHPIKHSIHRRTLIDRHNHLRVSDTRCCSCCLTTVPGYHPSLPAPRPRHRHPIAGLQQGLYLDLCLFQPSRSIARYRAMSACHSPSSELGCFHHRAAGPCHLY